jgi:hypothetical protein
MNTVYAINSINLIEGDKVKNQKVKFLKVKIKTLGEEARIIRKEELRANDNSLREELYLHRIYVVRKEARSTHIAYGLLRGRQYENIERSHDEHNEPDWYRIGEMIKKYGYSDDYQNYLAFLKQPGNAIRNFKANELERKFKL